MEALNSTVSLMGEGIAEEVTSWQQLVNTSNYYRNVVVLVTWIVLTTLMSFQLASAALKHWKPAAATRLGCCTSLIGGIYYIVMWLMVLCTFGLLCFTLGTADYCADADTNFESLGDIVEKEYLAYFTDCDTNLNASAFGSIGNPTNTVSEQASEQLVKSTADYAVHLKAIEIEYERISKVYSAADAGAKAALREGYIHATEDIQSVDQAVYGLDNALAAMNRTFAGSMSEQGFDAGVLGWTHGARFLAEICTRGCH
jgi:hypothetical protein